MLEISERLPSFGVQGPGNNFTTSHKFSLDAFVQITFQVAYFGIYGLFGLFDALRVLDAELLDSSSRKTVCTYEPACMVGPRG